MTPSLRSVMLAALLIAVASSIQAQAQDSWPGVLQAANREGSVMLYTSITPPVMQRISADFQKLHPGIRLEINRASGAPLLAKIDQERQANADGADAVVSTEMGWLEARAAEKSLVPPRGPNAAAWPAQYLIGGAAIIGALEPFVIAYNSSAVKFDVRGYSDLLRPEFGGGRLGVSAITSSTNIVAFYDWLEKTYGGELLPKIAAQKPRIFPGTVTPTQSVAAGEIIATVASNPASIRTLMDQGAPIKYAVPNPARGFSYGVAALRWSKRPNASLVLVDYLMSRSGQQAWNGKGESASPLRGIEGSLDASTITAAYNPKDYPPEFIQSYTEKWNRYFKN